MERRTVLAAAALLPWSAARAAASTAGHAWREVPAPQPIDDPARLHVSEFFWYGCGHCASLDPRLQRWARRHHASVERVPVAFTSRYEPQQRLYYALLAMGRADALQQRVFDAAQHAHRLFVSRDAIADWIARQGVSRTAFVEAYESFAVGMRVRRADQLARSYEIDAVPSLVVQGRWLVVPGTPATSSPDRLFAVLDELAQRAEPQRQLKPRS
ncbi:thiol:disulfide interchange protein DsbA precursor [mine drainage metagenome]|uniref:Thiol:disulfide interchange protein DsbA n=1 Tax=mine drainage metagenome TaxID=410659 RepID=A0A1J5QBV2_9ZZZZ